MVEDVMDGNILNNLYNTEERTNWWPCKTFDLRIATFWQRFGWTFILRRADGFKIVWWSTEISMPTLTQNNISRKLCVKSNFCYDSGDSNDFNVNTLASGERLRLSKACRSPALTCSQRMEDILWDLNKWKRKIVLCDLHLSKNSRYYGTRICRILSSHKIKETLWKKSLGDPDSSFHQELGLYDPVPTVPSLFDFLATICGQSRHRPRVWCSFLFIHLVWFSFKVSFGYFLSINIHFQLSFSFVFTTKKGIFSPARIRAPIMLSNPSFRVSKQGIW